MERRFTTKAVAAGLVIGGDAPITIQSMCNTDTLDVEASVRQCVELYNAGADIIRLTTQGPAQVAAFAKIKEQLHSMGIFTPLVADVHFSSKVAFLAAEVADKVRINPGNFSPDREKTKELLKELIDICRRHNTALRIGVNHGSLSKFMMEQYGNTPEGMAHGAMEYLKICKELCFDNVVVSLKASNTLVMTEAYSKLVELMDKEDMHYPLHLGVTEAGCGREARLKSASSIAYLLQRGYGDTIRVSLTEDPVEEILFGKRTMELFSTMSNDNTIEPQIDSSKTYTIEADTEDDLTIKASWMLGATLLCKPTKELKIKAIIAGKEMDEHFNEDFALDLLQATRCRFSKNEYISCPGCGRTMYNLQETVNTIKRATSHLKGYTIAVMGCIVNGPGEMADADFGYVGEARGKVSLYRGKERVMQGVDQTEAVDKLLWLIKQSEQSEQSEQ